MQRATASRGVTLDDAGVTCARTNSRFPSAAEAATPARFRRLLLKLAEVLVLGEQVRGGECDAVLKS